jgi:hypothetical protein
MDASKIGPLEDKVRAPLSLITVWCTHAHSISLPSETMKPNVLRFVIPSFCYRVSFPIITELLLHTLLGFFYIYLVLPLICIGDH